MASYSVRIKKSAARELADLPRKDQERVIERIRGLANDPRPPGAEKLAGSDDKFRLRQGNYRILYAIEDDVLMVYVVKMVTGKMSIADVS